MVTIKWWGLVLIFLAGIVVSSVGAALLAGAHSADLDKQLTTIKQQYAADIKAWTARLSGLSGQLSNSQDTVSSLTASLAASRARELRYQQAASGFASSAAAANAKLNAIIRAGESGSGDFDKAIAGLGVFGARSAAELGIGGSGP